MPSSSNIADTTQCLCLASRRAARTITRAFDAKLRSHGLRATQFTLLATLHIRGPQPISELADFLEIERTTMTRNIALLKRSSFVEAWQDDADSRRRIVAISEQGQEKLRAAFGDWQQVQSHISALLGVGAANQLRLITPRLETKRSSRTAKAGVDGNTTTTPVAS